LRAPPLAPLRLAPLLRDPVLEAPRALLAWALALFEDPPKALVFPEEVLLGACRFPMLLPPLLPRFAPMLPWLAPAFEPARFAPPAPVLFGRAPAFEPVRLAVLGCCLLLAPCCFCALACRVDVEAPLAVPPYLLAVAEFE